jgi:hypothetical protein
MSAFGAKAPFARDQPNVCLAPKAEALRTSQRFMVNSGARLYCRYRSGWYAAPHTGLEQARWSKAVGFSFAAGYDESARKFTS